MLYTFIDQHGKHLTISVRNEDGDETLHRQVSTRAGKPQAFFEELRERSAESGGYVAGLEVCGFNDWLVDRLPEWGCREIILIQPEQRQRQKTDRRDAREGSSLLWINRDRLRQGQPIQGVRRVHIPTVQERQDRQLTSMRKWVVAQRTKVINRIKHILRRGNRQHDCPTKGFQTVKARQWLRTLELDNIDRLELDQLLNQWDALDRQCAELEFQIRERFEQDPRAQLLATIVKGGSGAAYSALAVACRIGPLERFARPRSLANFFGLTPGCRNSGEVTQRLGSITKRGSSMVRFILAQWVLHVLRKDPAMRRWYREIKRRRGSKIARVAVMRRLATIIWRMLTDGRPYEIGGAPPRNSVEQPEEIAAPSSDPALPSPEIAAPSNGSVHQPEEAEAPSSDPAPPLEKAGRPASGDRARRREKAGGVASRNGAQGREQAGAPSGDRVKRSKEAGGASGDGVKRREKALGSAAPVPSSKVPWPNFREFFEGPAPDSKEPTNVQYINNKAL